MRRIYFTLVFLALGITLRAQDIHSLEQMLQLVRTQSYGAHQAEATREQAEADFDFFKSQLRPQFSLNANFPSYFRTSIPVVQPSGSISFQPVFQNSTSVTVAMEQAVLWTGGTLFVETGLDRFDDFGAVRSTFYNGIPIRVGYRQSLLGYNGWKWSKRIETARMELAKRQYLLELELVQRDAVLAYFEALLAQADVVMADSNRVANEQLMRITEERLALGKISRDEKLQMEMEYRQALMFVNQAANTAAQSRISLIGLLRGNSSLGEVLQVPEPFALSLPPVEQLLTQALENAPALRQAMLDVDIARSREAENKATWGPSLQIVAALGLAQSGATPGEVYRQPFNEQQLQAGVSIPIVDWGRKKAAVQSARHQAEWAETEAERQQQLLKQALQQLRLDLQELSNRLAIQADMVLIAEERYQIGRERYVAGNMPITELFIAQQRKDQTRRDYLLSLRDFYLAYYDLRALTGFEPISQKPIQY